MLTLKYAMVTKSTTKLLAMRCRLHMSNQNRVPIFLEFSNNDKNHGRLENTYLSETIDIYQSLI